MPGLHKQSVIFLWKQKIDPERKYLWNKNNKSNLEYTWECWASSRETQVNTTLRTSGEKTTVFQGRDFSKLAQMQPALAAMIQNPLLQYCTLQVSSEHGQIWKYFFLVKHLVTVSYNWHFLWFFQSINCNQILSTKTNFALEVANKARTHVVPAGGVVMISSESQKIQNTLPTNVKILYPGQKGKAASGSLIPINHRVNFYNWLVLRPGGTSAVLLKDACGWYVKPVIPPRRW